MRRIKALTRLPHLKAKALQKNGESCLRALRNRKMPNLSQNLRIQTRKLPTPGPTFPS
jgi:hypothetical protein